VVERSVVGLMVVAACSSTHSMAPPADSATAPATLRVFDSADVLSHGGENTVAALNVHVCVTCASCESGEAIAGSQPA
jgi:hypothetical protein